MRGVPASTSGVPKSRQPVSRSSLPTVVPRILRLTTSGLPPTRSSLRTIVSSSSSKARPEGNACINGLAVALNPPGQESHRLVNSLRFVDIFISRVRQFIDDDMAYSLYLRDKPSVP
jgi:hypothetical protein